MGSTDRRLERGKRVQLGSLFPWLTLGGPLRSLKWGTQLLLSCPLHVSLSVLRFSSVLLPSLLRAWAWIYVPSCDPPRTPPCGWQCPLLSHTSVNSPTCKPPLFELNHAICIWPGPWHRHPVTTSDILLQWSDVKLGRSLTTQSRNRYFKNQKSSCCFVLFCFHYRYCFKSLLLKGMSVLILSSSKPTDDSFVILHHFI